jgi:hypothetical protein
VRLALTILAASLVFSGPAAAQAPASPAMERTVSDLLAAYPDAMDRIEGGDLVWRDGTRMRIDDGKGAKPPAAWLATPDIKDIFAFPYPAGAPLDPPPAGADPGRARPAALFNKLYGNCHTAEVTPKLADVIWLPRKSGRTIKFNARHGAAARLQAVSARLDALPARFDKFLMPVAGTYVCRTIAGTQQISAHGYAIAIDLAPKHAHYWRWISASAPAPPAYRNDFPSEIVQAFEAEGFIWGGRWSHFDTMHFEYRPELIPRRLP